MTRLLINNRGETIRALPVSEGGVVLQIEVHTDATAPVTAGVAANLHLGEREAVALLCALGDALGVSVQIYDLEKLTRLTHHPRGGSRALLSPCGEAQADARAGAAIAYTEGTPIVDWRRRYTVGQPGRGLNRGDMWAVIDREDGNRCVALHKTFAAAYRHMGQCNEAAERRADGV